MKTKILLLLSGLLSVSVLSFGQVRTDINLRDKNNSAYDIEEEGYNAQSYSIGVGLGSSKMFGDLPASNPQPVYIGYFDKNVTPFFSYGQTLQVGDLSSNDPSPKWHLHSFNHFTSLDQHITMEVGGLFSLINRDYSNTLVLEILGGFYGGVGIGVISSNVKRLSNIDIDNVLGAPASSSPIQIQNSLAMYIPINVGYNLHLKKLLFFRGCMFNINFQYSDCLSDYVDGYKLPIKANKSNDVYTVMSVGFKFYISHNNRQE